MYGNEDSKDGKWRSDLYKSRRFGREGSRARDRELGIVKLNYGRKSSRQCKQLECRKVRMNDIENEKEVASNPSKVAQEITKPEVFVKSEVSATARKVKEGIVMKDKLAEYMKRKATLKEEHKKSRKPVFVASVKYRPTQLCDESVNGSNRIKGPNIERSSVASKKLMRLNVIKSNRETKSKVKAPGKKETACERKGLKEIDKNAINLSLERCV